MAALATRVSSYSTVYSWFRRWRLDGTWQRLNHPLRERVRVAAGREPQPSAAMLDSQSVMTTGVGGVRGYDGAKTLSGRKRHVLIDVLGLVLTGIDRQFPRLAHLWVDQGYTGSGKHWLEHELGWSAEGVRHPATGRFAPRRVSPA